MERHLKERLTGATVLVLLGVIFIPMVLDNSSEQQPPPSPDVSSSNPNSEYLSRVIPVDRQFDTDNSLQVVVPAADNSVQTLSQPVNVINESNQNDEKILVDSISSNDIPQQNRITQQAAPQPTADNTQVLSGWVVQLGSFSNQVNAQGLVSKLQAQGFAAFIEELADNSESIFRVRVGPELDRDDAENIQKSLMARTGIKGIIISYP